MGLVALDTPVHADKCLCAQNKHEQGGRGSIKSSCFMPSCPERATGGDQDLEGWRGKARGEERGDGMGGGEPKPNAALSPPEWFCSKMGSDIFSLWH